VKIDIHHQLLTWRKEIAVRGLIPIGKRISMKIMSQVLRRPWLYRAVGKLARTFTPMMPRFMIYNRMNGWGQQREIPQFPKQSFRQAFAKRKKKQGKQS
jgi:L-lactate dehydrogenase complex protein LldF